MFIRKITILLAIIFVFLIPTRLMALYGNDNMNFKSQDNNHDFSLDINSRDNVFIDKFDTGPSAKTQANFVVTESLMTDISSDEFYDEYDGCKTPPEKTTFYDTDTRAALWFQYENANVGETHKAEWYSPDGNLYTQGSGTSSYNNGCWFVSINIKGASAASKLGEWQVKVYRNNEHEFTLTFTIVSDSFITPTPSPTPTPTTCSDNYEPNDSSTQAYGYLTSGSSYSGKICSDSDVDWFKVNITTSGTISIDLTVPSSNDYYVELYGPSYTWLAGYDNGGTGASESITYSATTTGNYYIRVLGYNGSHNTTSSYTLAYTFTSTTSATPTPSPTPTPTSESTPTPTPTPTGIEDEDLLKKYAPILYMHSEEQFHPTKVEVMLENSELYEKICIKEKKDGTCKKYKGEQVKEMKDKKLTLDTLMDKYNDDKYYLKLKDKAAKKAKKKEWKERQTVYSRQTTDTDEDGKEKIVLQYWFFYVYNDWQNNHEGDWEMIQIILDSEEQPERITFGFHHGGKTFEWDEKDEDGEYKVRKSKNDNHPFVYVTLGGHGCWNDAGENKWYQIDTTYDLGGCLDCIDNTSEDGDILFPSTMRETEISNEQTNNKKYSYTIEDITDLKNENSDRIYWKGYWGEQSKKKLNGKDDAGKSGPPSPPYIDYIYTLLEKQGRWYEPIQWADDPLPSVYTVCSSANSKIIVNNSLSLFSNSCNPISDYDPFNYDECTSGCSTIMKIISVENIVFNIFSLDGEEVTLKISRYNRDTNEVHEVEFDWLEIPKNGKATLKFSPKKNPDFEIMVDNDLDNVTDRIVMPDYSTQYQR